jgi:Na+-driven multidrug efflux pump
MTGTAIMVSTAVGIVVPLLMIPNLYFLLGLIGATDELADLAYSYIIILLPATFLSGISMNLVSHLRADGAAAKAMYPSLCGALVNLIFDPILIFGLGMGLQGAAAATVMARAATMAVALYAFRGEIREILFPGSRAMRRHIAEMGSYALYSAFASVAAPIGQAMMMRHFASFGHEAVAGISIIGRLAPVVFSVINALAGAIGPIMAQNYGANEMERVSEAYKAAARFLGLYVAVVALLLFLLRAQIVSLFGATGVAQELIYLYCSPFAIIAFFNGLISVSNGALNSLGHPTYVMGLSWVKNTVGLLPFLVVGSYLYGLWGLAFGLLLHTAVFAYISVWLAKSVYLKKVASALPEKDFAQAEARAHSIMVREGAIQM